MTPEQREAADAYDAACKRYRQLIDEAETLIAELEALAFWDARVPYAQDRLVRALKRAEARLERRITAEVEV